MNDWVTAWSILQELFAKWPKSCILQTGSKGSWNCNKSGVVHFMFDLFPPYFHTLTTSGAPHASLINIARFGRSGRYHKLRWQIAAIPTQMCISNFGYQFFAGLIHIYFLLFFDKYMYIVTIYKWHIFGWYMFLLKRPFVWVGKSQQQHVFVAMFFGSVRCLTSTLVHNAWKVPMGKVCLGTWWWYLSVGH